jgi:hypothetical protein
MLVFKLSKHKTVKRDLHKVKSAQTSALKTALAWAFLHKIYYYIIINSLASTVFGADVCADFTLCKWPFICSEICYS